MCDELSVNNSTLAAVFKKCYADTREVYVSLSAHNTAIKHSTTITQWRRFDVPHKLEVILQNKDTKLPYLLRVCPYVPQNRTVWGTKLVKELEKCPGITWNDVEEELKALIAEGYVITISPADAFYLAMGIGPTLLRDLNLVQGVSDERKNSAMDVEISQIARKVSDSYFRCLPENRVKIKDALTTLNVQAQVYASKDCIAQSPEIVRGEMQSSGDVLLGAGLAAGSYAAYHLFKYFKENNGYRDIIVGIIKPLITSLSDAVVTAIGTAISSLTLCYIVSGIIIAYIAEHHPTFVKGVALALLLAGVMCIILARNFRRALLMASKALKVLGYNSNSEWIENVQNAEVIPGFMQGTQEPTWSSKVMISLIAVFFTITPNLGWVNSIFARTRAFNSTVQAEDKVADLVRTFMELVPTVIDDLLHMRSPYLTLFCQGGPEQALAETVALLKEHGDTQFDINIMKLAVNREYRLEFIKKYERLQLIIKNGSTSTTVLKDLRFRAVMDRAKALQKHYQSALVLEYTPKTVLTPFVVSMYGLPGIGKSSIIGVLSRSIFGPDSVPYARNASDPFWSGYNPSFSTVVFDDFGANRSQNQADDDIVVFKSIITNNPVRLLMPSVEADAVSGTKGEIFRSPLVILATNFPYPKSNNINDLDAVLRRRNLCFHVVCKPEYRLGTETKHTTDWEKVVKKIGNNDLNAMYNEALEFYEYDKFLTDEPKTIFSKSRTFMEFLAYTNAQFTKWIVKEVTRCVAVQQTQRIGTLPEFDLASFENLMEQPGPSPPQPPPAQPVQPDEAEGNMQAFSTRRARHAYYRMSGGGEPVWAQGTPRNYHDQPRWEARPGVRANGRLMPIIHVDDEGNIQLGDINRGNAILHEDDDQIAAPVTEYHNSAYMMPHQQEADDYTPDLRNHPDDPWWVKIWHRIWYVAYWIVALAGLDPLPSPESGPVYMAFMRAIALQTRFVEPGTYTVPPGQCGCEVAGVAHAFRPSKCRPIGIRRLRFQFHAMRVAFRNRRWNLMAKFVAEILQAAVYHILIMLIGNAIGILINRLISAIVGISSSVKHMPGLSQSRESSGGMSRTSSVRSVNVVPGRMQGDYGEEVQAQEDATEPPTCNDALIMKTAPNSFQLYTQVEGNSDGSWSHALFVAGRSFLMNRHVLYELPLEKVRLTLYGCGLYTTSITQEVRTNESFTFMLNTCNVGEFRADSGETDLILVEAPIAVRSFPSLISHFMKNDELAVFHDAQLIVRQGVNALVHATEASYYGRPIIVNSPKGTHLLSNPYTYPLKTKSGMCGCPLITRYGNSSDRIIGVHCVLLASGEESAVAEAVTQESLIGVLEAIDALSADCAPRGIKYAPTGYTTMTGAFTQFGFIGSQTMDQTSQLAKSVFAKIAEPTTKDIAILRRKDERFEKARKRNPNIAPTPLLHAISKYDGVAGKSIDMFAIQRAIEEYNTVIVKQRTNTQPKLYTISETMNREDGLAYFPMNTSPGLPYTEQRLRRRDLIEVLSDGTRVPRDRLVHDVIAMEERFGRGDPAGVIWKDFLKDELLNAEKIAAGKTRHITCGPVPFVILCRRYIGAFELAFSKCSFTEGTAYGMTPESGQWHNMITYLKGCGDKGASVDYSKFDGTIPPEIIQAVFQIIESFYTNATRQDRMVRKAIMENIVHSVMRCDDLLYAKHKGNPSGCPITTLLNTIANWLLQRVATLKTCPEITAQEYYRAGFVAYGDDLLFVPTQKMLDKGFSFEKNAKFLGEYGITMRNELADGWELTPVEELVFLKRRTRFSEELNQYVPVMASETVEDILYWTRMGEREMQGRNRDLIENRLQAALLFYYYRGPEVFAQKRAIIQQRCDELNLSHLRLFDTHMIEQIHHKGTSHMLLEPQHYEMTVEEVVRAPCVLRGTMQGQASSTTNNVVYNNGNGNGTDIRNASEAKASMDFDVNADLSQNASLDCKGLHGNILPLERLMSGYNSNSNIPVAAEMMSLITDNFVPTTKEHFGVSVDEMNMRELASRFVRSGVYEWKDTDPVNTVIAKGFISPFTQTHTNKEQSYSLSPMEVFALMHSFWESGLVVRVEVVATPQHAGKLFLGVHYGNYDLPGITLEPIEVVTGQYGAYIDIHEANIFEYKVDYRASTKALNVLWQGLLSGSLPVQTAMGTWTLVVVNELAVQSVVTPTVEVNMYWAAGSNFRTHYPRSIMGLRPVVNTVWRPDTPTVTNASCLYAANFVTNTSNQPQVSQIGEAVLELDASSQTDVNATLQVPAMDYPVTSGGPKVMISLFMHADGDYLTQHTTVIFWDGTSNVSVQAVAQKYGPTTYPLYAFFVVVPTQIASGPFTATFSAHKTEGQGVYFRVASYISGYVPGEQCARFHIAKVNNLTPVNATVTVSTGGVISTSTPSGDGLAETPHTALDSGTQKFSSFDQDFGELILVTMLGKTLHVLRSVTANGQTNAPYWTEQGGYSAYPTNNANNHIVSMDIQGPTSSGSFASWSGDTWDSALQLVIGFPKTILQGDPEEESTSVIAKKEPMHLEGNMQSDTEVAVAPEERIESAPVHANEAGVAKVIGTSTGYDGGNEHFGEHDGDLRHMHRRFIHTDTVTLSTVGERSPNVRYSINDLMLRHPWFALVGPSFRLMRGNVRLRFNMTYSSNPQLAAKILVSQSTKFAPVGVPIADGLATKYISAQTPSATIEIPYLSSLHTNYTPFGVPLNGNSYESCINITTNAPEDTTMRIDILVGFGDNFRLGGFTGMRQMFVTTGAPNFLPGIMQSRTDNEGGIYQDEIKEVQTVAATVRDGTTMAMHHMNEQDWTVSDMLSRTGFVKNVTWNINDAIGHSLTSLHVPLELIANDISKVAFQRFRFFRFKSVKIRFAISASQMHAGKLIAYYRPGVPLADESSYTLDSATALDQHVLIDPSRNTVTELEIPFQHPLGYLHVGEDEMSASETFTRFLGHVHVVVWNGLRIGSGKSSLSLNITAQFQDASAKILKIRAAT